MANVYIRSLVWLAALGGLGFGLLQLTPDNRGTSKIYSEKYNANLTEEQKKKALLFQKLQESAKSEPIYLQKPKSK